MTSWRHKPGIVHIIEEQGSEEQVREDLDIAARPCSHVFQCLNHLANERETQREKGQRESDTPDIS